jgi:short-subunit dehydrogenase
MLTVEALTRLTYAVVRAFLKRGSGTIVNLGSILSIGSESPYTIFGSTNAFVRAFSQSLQHDLSNAGVKVQAVLPGATATNLWNAAGTPVKHLPLKIVTPLTEMVDTALASLDQGELVTIVSPPDAREWQNQEATCRALLPNLPCGVPAAKYATSALEG